MLILVLIHQQLQLQQKQLQLQQMAVNILILLVMTFVMMETIILTVNGMVEIAVVTMSTQNTVLSVNA